MAGKTSPQLRKQFTDLVVYKDAIVAIKKLNDTFNMTDILKKEKQELKTMMILDHRYEFSVDKFLNKIIFRNIALFHGLLSDEGNHFLLQEYGVRGSLEDILSSKIQLTWEVKRSLVNDIVDGMAG